MPPQIITFFFLQTAASCIIHNQSCQGCQDDSATTLILSKASHKKGTCLSEVRWNVWYVSMCVYKISLRYKILLINSKAMSTLILENMHNFLVLLSLLLNTQTLRSRAWHCPFLLLNVKLMRKIKIKEMQQTTAGGLLFWPTAFYSMPRSTRCCSPIAIFYKNLFP